MSLTQATLFFSVATTDGGKPIGSSFFFSSNFVVVDKNYNNYLISQTLKIHVTLPFVYSLLMSYNERNKETGDCESKFCFTIAPLDSILLYLLHKQEIRH